jgi:uncharacterized protein YciI
MLKLATRFRAAEPGAGARPGLTKRKSATFAGGDCALRIASAIIAHPILALQPSPRTPSMHYLLIYEVGPDYVERRKAWRGEHLALAQAAVARGELILGGALDAPADKAVLLFCGETAEVAESFARQDPYVLNGLVHSWSVRTWLTVVGRDSQVPLP